MIWIAGGTHEVRELLESLNNLYENILITVTTPEAKELLPKDANVLVGPVLREDIPQFIKEHDIELIIDLTHPFATRISESLRIMADRTNTRLIRYVRPGHNITDPSILNVANIEEAINLNAKLKGNFLFTTGSKNATDFLKVRGSNRFIFRVLPSSKSIGELSDNGVEMKDIIAVMGPFSYDFNKAIYEDYNIDYMITKDSGEGSGFEEKIKSALDANVRPIVIMRDNEIGTKSLYEIKNIILNKEMQNE